MTLITQVGIGIAYTKVFSFSFEVLRWSTLINALLCTGVMYLLARQLTTERVAAFLAALLLFNPLFFSLSFTFMTEVHFVLLLLLSFWYFFRYAERSHYSYLAGATVFSVLATLLRQPGLLVPLSAGVVLVFVLHGNGRKALALLPVFVTYGALKMYLLWSAETFPQLFRVAGLREAVTTLMRKDIDGLLEPLGQQALSLGLWLLPLTILLLPHLYGLYRRYALWIAGIGVVLAVVVATHPDEFPSGNVFYNLGLGPKVLKGHSAHAGPSVSDSLWNAIDYLALVGLVNLGLLTISPVAASYRSIREGKGLTPHARWWMLLLFCATYSFVALLAPISFDRHVLPLLPAVSILVLPAIDKNKGKLLWGPALICLSAYTVFSLVATHDYLSWNRARARAYTYLTDERGIDYRMIDAGFELNGWRQAGPEMHGGPRSWWFVTDDAYIISFIPHPGYSTERSFSYPTLLPNGSGTLHVLVRTELLEE